MRRMLTVICIGVMIVALGGCGGSGGDLAAPPSQSGDQAPAPSEQIGPFMIQTAANANLVVESIPNDDGAAFVAIHGATLTYVSSQEMLDRIVFSSTRDGSKDLYVCDLFGGTVQQVTDTGGASVVADWSPGGERIAYGQHDGTDYEIATISPDGTGAQVLTANGAADNCPSWSHTGRQIAFQSRRDGDLEIYTMYADGGSQTNVSNAPTSTEIHPAWGSPSNMILFASDRDDTGKQIYGMAPDGSSVLTLASGILNQYAPCHNPTTAEFAYHESPPGGPDEVYTADRATAGTAGVAKIPVAGDVTNFSQTSADDQFPSWSTDGRYIAFHSDRSGDTEVYVQEVGPPYRVYRATAAGGTYPDLGSPTLQTSRVLIGPDGADRGFDPPITPRLAFAAVLAFDGNGYRNFLRIGLFGSDVDTLEVTPRDDVGDELVALEVSASRLVNLVQDNGPGEAASRWNLAGGDAEAALLMFNSDSGKLIAVLSLQDEAYPTAADASGVSFSAEGAATTVSGSFGAVYGPDGELIAEGELSTVQIDADSGRAAPPCRRAHYHTNPRAGAGLHTAGARAACECIEGILTAMCQ